MNQLTDEWVIGFIEGEGSFLILNCNGYRIPQFEVSQGNQAILESLCSFFGFGRVRQLRRKGENWAYEVWGLKNVFWLVEFFDGRLRHPSRINQFTEWKAVIYQQLQRRAQKPKCILATELAESGVPYSDIAQILGCTKHSVPSYVWRGRWRPKIGQVIERMGYEEALALLNGGGNGSRRS